MLNRHGQTPLDVAILETISAVESQQKMKGKKDIEEAQESVEHATEKAQMLIRRMQRYGPDCSIRFIKKPHRLDLKFCKSFAMAVKRNKNEILHLFPRNSIHTAYIGLHQLMDYKQYKNSKEKLKEQLTTPLHIAC